MQYVLAYTLTINQSKVLPMVDKLTSFFHGLSDYIISIMGIIVVGIVELLKIVDMRLLQESGMSTQSSGYFKVVDGHLLLSELSVVEVLQITLLGLSILVILGQITFRCCCFIADRRNKRRFKR